MDLQQALVFSLVFFSIWKAADWIVTPENWKLAVASVVLLLAAWLVAR